MALPGESYKLALTPGLLDLFQSKASARRPDEHPHGHRRRIPQSRRRWQSLDSFRPGVLLARFERYAAAGARLCATAHFFLPHRFQDPFGNDTVVTYDAKYILLPVLTHDAVGNATSADHDYRVLQPATVTDPNGNRPQARFDALGMLAGTAVLGKGDGPGRRQFVR